MILYLLIFGVISSAVSLPAKSNSLYNTVVNDPRSEKLRGFPFLKECKSLDSVSKSLCYLLYDVQLSFYERELNYTTVNVTVEEDSFCETLKEALPDSPSNNDSKTAFNNEAWFKDTLKKDDGVCNQRCIYEDRQSYEKKVASVCQFLLNQFSFLKNQSNTPKVSETAKNVEIRPASLNETQQKVSTGIFDKPSDKTSAAVTKNVEPTQKESTEDVASKVNSIPDKSTKPITTISPEPPLKPIVQSSTPAVPVKTSESTKAEVPKAEESDKQEIGIAEEIENNPFDGDKDGDTAEKETDPKITENYVDDEDDNYGEDPIHNRNNNNQPEIKIPQDPEPTVNDVPHKKIEIVDFEEDPDSNFFTYLCILMFLCVLLYILHQNRHKLLALCLEGRRGNRRGRERSRGGSKAAYSKLDCNLEEAIMSNKSLSGKGMDVIY